MASAGAGRTRRPGARERRGDLAADDPGFAHPGHEHRPRHSNSARSHARSLRRCVSTRRRIAAASVRSTVRARSSSDAVGVLDMSDQPRSDTVAHAGAGCNRVDPGQPVSRGSSRSSLGRSAHRSSPVQGARGLLHEHAVDAGSDAGPGQWLDELGLTGGHAVPGARQLQAVGHVVDHGMAEAAQHRQRAHVHDEVVVAERGSTLGQDHPVVAGAATSRQRSACRRGRGTDPS